MTATLTRAEIELEIAAFALSQVDVPWEHQGRAPGHGLDCVGLGVCSARAQGLRVIDNLEYPEHPSSSQLMEYIQLNCEQVGAPVVGGLTAFWVRHEDSPKHAGVPVGGGRFVHALRCLTDEKQSRVRLDDFAGFWSKHTHTHWRYKWAGMH